MSQDKKQHRKEQHKKELHKKEQHKKEQHKKEQLPGVVNITIHPQQNRVSLQLSLQHAVDDKASPLLQAIAVVLVGDAGQNPLNATCVCNAKAEHKPFLLTVLVHVTQGCVDAAYTLENLRKRCTAYSCCTDPHSPLLRPIDTALVVILDRISSIQSVHTAEPLCM